MLGRLLSLFGGNTLYYPGCLTKSFLPRIQNNYEELLRKAGIDFIVLDAPCCGSPVRNAGYEGDFAALAEKNRQMFAEYSVKRVITNCPACYNVLGQTGVAVEHATVTVKSALERGRLRAMRKSGVITYHDPCHLGRYAGIYEEPRAVLRMLGYEVREMQCNRERSLCCGGGGGLRSNCEALSNVIAKQRLAEAAGVADTLVTTCPMCYAHFRENAGGVRVLEFSEVVLDAV
jgi:Fe-S oxidoreductase